MKKIITLAIAAAALFVAAPANAQLVKFGVKGGLNVNKMKVDGDLTDSKNQAGFFIGPTVKFTLPVTGLGIDAAALFDQRTSKWEDTEDGITIEEKVKQQSIQIPINLRYGVGLGDLASIYFFAGPQFGINVGDKDKGVFDNEVKWTSNSTNFSLNVGLGATLIKHLQVSANYNIGLGKTGEFKEESTFNQVVGVGKSVYKGTNNTWQIALAYYF